MIDRGSFLDMSGAAGGSFLAKMKKKLAVYCMALVSSGKNRCS